MSYFQASLAKLEEACRQEMEKHKQLLDKEYEQLLTQFSKELEKLQLKHQEELGKRLKMNINTEKKLIKEVSQVFCKTVHIKSQKINITKLGP